jgi:predicted PurR-regulated permease PerM
MPFLDDAHQRAGAAILVLAALLAVALFPFATGLLAIPVLYVIFRPLYRRFTRWLPRSGAAAAAVGIGVVVVLFPLATVAAVMVTEANSMASGVDHSRLLADLGRLRIGPYSVGPVLADLGRRAAEWIAGGAVSLVGAATRFTLNLVISFVGLFYLLGHAEAMWGHLRPYIPFSAANADRLRERFEHVTISTVIGTGATALVQGTLVGVAFAVLDLEHGVAWGVITAVVSVVPVVGSALVWVPGAIALAIEGRALQALGLGLWGAIVVANIDNLIRPMVYRRWANVHPLVTIVGVFAGVRYFGLLGLLVGPLAISYFFELLRMYREEYVEGRKA